MYGSVVEKIVAYNPENVQLPFQENDFSALSAIFNTGEL